jgi:copper oxidase (laccase) domain-containing protein
MMLTSPNLSRLSGIAHAFFTREGGVSEGVYASLNGGLGSGDERARVIENRKRMAAALGVAPKSFATVFQVHSPDAIVIDEPWDEGTRPLADAMVTRRPGLAIAVSSADCGPCGMEGRAHRRHRGDGRGDGRPRRQACPDPRGAGADDLARRL